MRRDAGQTADLGDEVINQQADAGDAGALGHDQHAERHRRQRVVHHQWHQPAASDEIIDQPVMTGCDAASREHRFAHLRIAAAPRFLGRLRKALDREVSDVVDEEIDRDLLQLDTRTLTQRFYGAADPPATTTRH